MFKCVPNDGRNGTIAQGATAEPPIDHGFYPLTKLGTPRSDSGHFVEDRLRQRIGQSKGYELNLGGSASKCGR